MASNGLNLKFPEHCIHHDVMAAASFPPMVSCPKQPKCIVSHFMTATDFHALILFMIAVHRQRHEGSGIAVVAVVAIASRQGEGRSGPARAARAAG
jgi:hypothetical protein